MKRFAILCNVSPFGQATNPPRIVRTYEYESDAIASLEYFKSRSSIPEAYSLYDSHENPHALATPHHESARSNLLALGVPPEEIDHHASDLYVKVGALSSKFVNSYKYKSQVSTFTSRRDGERWYEIPFAYSEYFANGK